jgi:hypothetical protein
VQLRKALRPALDRRKGEPHRFDDQLYHRQINDRSRNTLRASPQVRHRHLTDDAKIAPIIAKIRKARPESAPKQEATR